MDRFEINEWQKTIEELKSDLSEASPYLNYFKRFLGKKPVPTTPSPIPFTPAPSAVLGQKYIKQLDTALQNSQMKLSAFVSSLPLDAKIVRKNMEIIDFIKISKNVISKGLKPTTIEKKPIAGFDFRTNKPTVKTKHNLPINPIFEGQSSDWKKRAEDLTQVMNGAYQEVSNVLLTIAKDSGYPPTKTNIRSLIANMKNYTILDKESAKIIKQKLDGFVNTYKYLESWLAFFHRTAQNQEKAQKNKTS